MKRFLTLLLVMILTLSLTACGTDPQGSVPSDSSDDHSDPAQTQGSAEEIIQGKEYLKTYKTSFSSSYPSFNYFSTAYGTVRGIVANCIDGLVEPDIYGVYAPSMAESWTVNSDQTVWTFKIRKGVNWVDHTGADTGMSVTAQDFVDGIRYIGDPLNGAYSLRVIRNLITGLYDYYWTLDDIDSGLIIDQTREDVVAQFDQMVGVKALDEYTVEYTLTSSAPYFLSLVESSMLLLPVEYDYATSLGEDFAIDNEHMLYCGAYYISEFQRDKAITLTKNPLYWDLSQVTVDTVEYQMVPDGTTSLEMFKRGEIDSTSVESEEFLSMKGSEWEDNLIPTERSLSTNYLWLAFQSANPEWNTFINNANFRKALQYSLDRVAIASLRDPVSPERVVRNTVNAEDCIYDDSGKEYTDYEPLKTIKETDYNNAELARSYMETAVAELCDDQGNILGVNAGTVDYLPVGTYEVDGKLPVTIIYVGTDDEDEIVMAQLMEAMIEEALGSDYVDFVPVCFSGWTYGTVADPLNYDIYFDSLSTGYADPSGILSRLTSDGAENMGQYEVPEYDAMVEEAEKAATFEERLQKFAEAEAWLVDNGYVMPFISSLRGYYMTNCVPYTSPLTLYGNSKYKGTLVMEEPLTAEEYNTLTAAYELNRAAALATN